MSPEVDVLIVGAGPTGLVLASWLARLSVRLRIVDQAPQPGTTSRAVAIQGRTLELYDQMGLARAVVARGQRAEAANLWAAGRRTARAPLGDLGRGLSPFPFALIFPQDEHEQLLIDDLAQLGVVVERGVSLVALDDGGDVATATLEDAGGARTRCAARFVAGCDGAHSNVRGALGIGFPGGTYEHLFYVADVEARGAAVNGEINVSLESNDFLVVFPMKGAGRVRLIGTMRADGEREPGWDDVSRAPIAHMHLEVDRVHWFSTYHVHHRVADRYRRGRAFLAGDAAHIHSPVGGQGMNTGIGDAINLAWKLAAVVHGRCGEWLLDTYEPERIAFARRLVDTTDRAFVAVTSPSATARFLRMRAVPAILPLLLRLEPIRRLLFRTVSQIAVNYRGSRLSEGRAGRVEGGDRLPWTSAEDGDNFAPLTSLAWQVHVYGEAAAALRQACAARGLPLHVFAWSESVRRAGFARGAAYLVRPDGYVAFADSSADAAALAAFLDGRGLTFR